MAVEVSQLHNDINALVEKFDIVSKIQELQQSDGVRSSG
jgi:hypothetical protein